MPIFKSSKKSRYLIVQFSFQEGLQRSRQNGDRALFDGIADRYRVESPSMKGTHEAEINWNI